MSSVGSFKVGIVQRAPPHLLSQGNILHLAQRKYPPATTCLRVLMDEPMMEDTCSNISPPSEAREWTASVQECMKGPPAKAHVLYARVEDADKENWLLCTCKAGLVVEKDKKQELKLHATLMNTSYRKRKSGKRFGRRVPFDARPILAVHGSDDWGEYTVTEVHLSQRFVYDEDGYYHCCGSVKLPFQGLST
ncbi:hypothetical protein L7F22_014510 [Adiantum nelumboides]|nr:hypothetical protein [Adiantum nelumboides]